MSDPSVQDKRCHQCGAEMPETDGSFCPRCLMAQIIEPTQAGDQASPMPVLTPEELAPHFPQLEVIALIGSGGMGAVFKARQPQLDRFVALKILPVELADQPGFSERFQREAQALAKLSHPHIVTVHDFGRAGEFYFLLMEFVDGVNLRQAMKAGRFTPEQALAVVPPVCEALQYAHEHGIVHRDIKPENLLLDKAGRVKIADFGIAKMIGENSLGILPVSTESTDETPVPHSIVAGTPQYMAPEQKAHGVTDHRVDIYSLGVVLYEMLTGELPDKELQAPSRKVHIDVRLDEVVLRALEKDPELRYQQAIQVKKSVETIIEQANPNNKEGSSTMKIQFICPKCNQRLSVDQSAAGTQVSCPACSELMVVPSSVAPHASPPPVRRFQPSPQGYPTIPPKRAGALAIWALVLGIIGIVPVFGLATGVIGLALGITALVKQTTSKGIAIAGTVLGGIATLMIPLHLAMLTPIFYAAKFGAGTAVCLTNLKAIGVGIEQYKSKNNGVYPDSLDALVKQGIISEDSLHCPVHDGKSGGSSYTYLRPDESDNRGIIAWDRFPHRAMGNKVVGRNILNSDYSVRFTVEQQFREPRKTVSKGTGGSARLTPPTPPKPARNNGTEKPIITSQSPPEKPMTVASAIDALKSSQTREMRPPLKFLADAPATSEDRAAVITAVKPILNDTDNGEVAFQAFANWAGNEQVPDLIDFVRIAPTSARSKQSMKLLSRMGDVRAAEPLAACLVEFHIARDAKAALAALGVIAKPAVLPLYHHEDRNAREAARELLRGYNITDAEIFAESIKALGGGGETSRSALQYLSTAKLTPEQRTAAALALRPFITHREDRVRDGARNAMKILATPADADFLLEQMKSTDDATRQFATDLLVGFKDARAAKLIAILLSDNHKTYAAGKALISLGSAAEPAVIPYLRNEDPNTRKRAAEVLAEIGTSASLPDLQKMTKDKNFFAKTSAERAVNTIKSRAAGATGKR